jgi:hypothetical protein
MFCGLASNPPFPVTVFFLLASISSIRRMYRLSRRRTVYVCLLGVKCLVPLSDGLEGRTFPTTPLRPKTTGGFNRARECIGPTRPYYNARNRGSSIRATNCACDAECWLAPVTLSFLLTTSLFDCNLGDVLGAHVTRSSLPLRMLPHHRRARWTTTGFVCVALPHLTRGLTLSAGVGGGGAVQQPWELARAIWHAYGCSSLLRPSKAESLVQADSWYSRRSKIQITVSPYYMQYHPVWSGTLGNVGIGAVAGTPTEQAW